MVYHIALLGEDGCPIREDRAAYCAEHDPFERQSRALLHAKELYARGKGRKDRLTTLEASLRLQEEHERPLPHHLPETVKTIVVTSAGGEGQYFARYEVKPLTMTPVTLTIPEGGGGPSCEFGDFSDYAMQPYAAEWGFSLWETGWLYVRIVDRMPFPDDSDEASRFGRALARSRFVREGLHIVGRNLHPAKVQVMAPRIRPRSGAKYVKKGRQRRQ